MNTLQKTMLYPIAGLIIIVLMTSLNWLLTAFFSIIFDTTINNVACSPIVIIYGASFIGTIYMVVNCCIYIDEKL